MRIVGHTAGAVLALGLLIPSPSAAQAVWDAPAFVRPGVPRGLTVALTDAEPGDGLGVLALWRSAPVPSGLGFRAGIAEAPGGDVVALLGVDVSGSLTRVLGTGAPAGIWWSGVGAGLSDDVTLSVPLGVALSWAWVGDGASVMPYAGCHLAFDAILGGADDLDLEGALDLGMDFAISRLLIRVAAALGGRDALAIGVRIPR